MGWQDRAWSRDSGRGGFRPLEWILFGSVPLFTVFGIRVRAHAQLLIAIGLVLITGLGPGFTVQDRIASMTALFVIVLLHEFGHCFAARAVGGQAEEIVMNWMGGLASAYAPRRWLPQLITVAGGPAVNVVICLVCAAGMYAIRGTVPWNPWAFRPGLQSVSWLSAYWYLVWIFQISWLLLLFNLLPVFPLDGGQLLQAVLWRWVGYYRSMLFTVTAGIAGGLLMAVAALATHQLLMFWIGVSCLITCVSMRGQLKAAGPWGFEEETTDLSAAFWQPSGGGGGKRRRGTAAADRRAEREASAERSEQLKIDRILAKVSRQGMASLGWLERRTLRQATDRQRRRDLRRRG